MLAAANSLTPTPGSPLRPAVMRIALVLLYTAGLRRGELLRLTLDDCDPRAGVLRIRASKFHKSRLVPLSPDARTELRTYLRQRLAAPLDASPQGPLLCHTTRGFHGYTGTGLSGGIHELFKLVGVRDDEGRRPRIHDLRHSFAVQALMRWYRDGADVQSNLPKLAMYMGHVSIASTIYYLRFIPALAALASERFERQFRQPCRGGGDMKPRQVTQLGRCLVRFFQEYLPSLRGLSRHTIHSYRDSLVLFLQFTARDAGHPIEVLEIADVTADRVERFLTFLEADRHNGIATRNTRLAALHTFVRFVIADHPEHIEALQHVLGIPFKRGARVTPVEYLETVEIAALLDSIDRSTPVRAARLRAVRPDVQYRCPGAGDPGPACPRPSARTALPGSAARQGQQGPALPDLAAHGPSAPRDHGEPAGRGLRIPPTNPSSSIAGVPR